MVKQSPDKVYIEKLQKEYDQARADTKAWKEYAERWTEHRLVKCLRASGPRDLFICGMVTPFAIAAVVAASCLLWAVVVHFALWIWPMGEKVAAVEGNYTTIASLAAASVSTSALSSDGNTSFNCANTQYFLSWKTIPSQSVSPLTMNCN